MKGPSKNINSMHFARKPILFLGLRAKNFQKSYTLCDFLEATVKNLKSGFSLFHCYCIPPPGCILTKAYQSLCSGNDMTGAKKFEKGPCSTKKVKMTVFHQNLRNDHAPQKFENRPCSIKKFEKRPCSIEK